MKEIYISRRQISVCSMSMNLLYALGNAGLGFAFHSDWLICAAAYYAILSMLRFTVIRYGFDHPAEGGYLLRFCGILFLHLSITLTATVFLTLKYETGRKTHEIIMITMALYSFSKISLAIANYVKYRRRQKPRMIALGSIAFADGAVSIFSLQRSMLVSFGDMAVRNIRIFNLLTGTGICLLVFGLGMTMLRYERKNNHGKE